jgi:hypothetical protein
MAITVQKPVEFPPMAPWPMVQNGVIDHFKERGGQVPPFFVNDTLKGVTPELRGRVLASLRALKLTDSVCRTQPFFQTLVDARGTGQWQAQLRVLMNTAYPYLSFLNLSQADSAALRAAFVAYTKKDTENLGKAEVFFLNLARAAGVRLSDALQKRVTASEAMAAVQAARRERAAKDSAKGNKPVKPETKDALTPHMTDEHDLIGYTIDMMRFINDRQSGLSAKEVEAFVTLLEAGKKRQSEKD